MLCDRIVCALAVGLIAMAAQPAAAGGSTGFGRDAKPSTNTFTMIVTPPPSATSSGSQISSWSSAPSFGSTRFGKAGGNTVPLLQGAKSIGPSR